MNWREQRALAADMMGDALDLMAVGRHDEAIVLAREANRLTAEAIEWRWANDPPAPVLRVDGEPAWLEPPSPPELTP